MEQYGKDPTESLDYANWLAARVVEVVVAANANKYYN